jgi:hypothetical protein
MPIPELDDHGVLPPGVYDCSLDELQERFGRFEVSERRVALCARLAEFCTEARGTPIIVEIIVDGSFVTSKAEPNDIDLVVVLSADHPEGEQLRPFEYNLLSRRRVRRSFGFDVLVARAASAEYHQYIEFFAQVRGAPDITKGLLRVRP